MNDIECIENCYKQMYLGMVKKDRSILSEVLDDSFVLFRRQTHMAVAAKAQAY